MSRAAAALVTGCGVTVLGYRFAMCKCPAYFALTRAMTPACLSCQYHLARACGLGRQGLVAEKRRISETHFFLELWSFSAAGTSPSKALPGTT